MRSHHLASVQVPLILLGGQTLDTTATLVMINNEVYPAYTVQENIIFSTKPTDRIIMVEQLSVEESISRKGSRPSAARTLFFNVYLILSSFCAIAGLVIASVSLHTANELMDFKSSHFTTDLERTFNSTVYAIANSGPTAPACENLAAESVTGQTSIPGQCVTVADSWNMWVTRLAQNCAPYAYAQENCSGVHRQTTNITFGVPNCVVAAGAGELDGADGNFFRSFQILCT